MKLGQICEFRVNFPEADFWLIRKGDINTVGTPTKNFSEEHIGVKVLNTDLFLPNYLYYVFMYLQQRDVFSNLATGTLNLKNIRISDIKDIDIG